MTAPWWLITALGWAGVACLTVVLVGAVLALGHDTTPDIGTDDELYDQQADTEWLALIGVQPL